MSLAIVYVFCYEKKKCLRPQKEQKQTLYIICKKKMRFFESCQNSQDTTSKVNENWLVLFSLRFQREVE